MLKYGIRQLLSLDSATTNITDLKCKLIIFTAITYAKTLMKMMLSKLNFLFKNEKNIEILQEVVKTNVK